MPIRYFLITLLILGCVRIYLASGLRAKYGPQLFATVPEECEGQNYCFEKNDQDYPQQHMYRLFSNFTRQIQTPETSLVKDKFGDRDDIDDCQSFPTFNTIYFLKAKNNWRVVVNLPDVKFITKIRLEVCNNAGKPCFKFDNVPSYFKPKCKQMYSTWEVLVLDDNGKAKAEDFEVPTCCVCSTD